MIRVRTLADLGTRFSLAAWCRRCARWQMLDRNAIGAQVPLDRVRQRLRCTGCGARDALLYRIWTGGAQDGYGPPTD